LVVFLSSFPRSIHDDDDDNDDDDDDDDDDDVVMGPVLPRPVGNGQSHQGVPREDRYAPQDYGG